MSEKQDPSKNWGAFLYTVSHERDFLQNYFHVQEDAVEQLKLYHEHVQDDPAGAVKGLIKLADQYPGVPQIKNLLGAAYQLSGNDKKATEVNERILREHPDYLFGKLNKAYHYFFENKPEKIPELLGQWLEIRALYPKRDVFHISEVMAFNKVVCLYYMAIKKFDVAESHLVVMEKIDSGHPDAIFIRQKLFGNMN